MIPRVALYVSCARDIDQRSLLSSLPDAVIYDLEDSTPVALKDEARARAISSLQTPQPWCSILRINHPSTPAGAADVAALAKIPRDVRILVPKALSAEPLGAAFCDAGRDRFVWRMLECQDDISNMLDLTTQTRQCEGFVLGYKDLAADMGVAFRPMTTALRKEGLRALNTAKNLGIPLLDGVTVGDDAEIQAGLQHSVAAGFTGVTLYRTADVHPARLAFVARDIDPRVVV